MKPKLSVVCAFYNMRREAARTLYSLTTQYQLGVTEADYEVLALDSNSSEPLDADAVEGLQSNFSYHFIETEHSTPCRAMNAGIHMARADDVVCLIDGARMLSPGILSGMIEVKALYERPLIYTIGMHLGEEPQNVAIVQTGYDQQVENELLSTIDWELDGYKLFGISSLAWASSGGFFGTIGESNCFSCPRSALLEVGGFDERFTLPGGGIVLKDTLSRLHASGSLQPVLLLGEATFHQFHGGVATNVPEGDLRTSDYLEEYRRLRGRDSPDAHRDVVYFGRITDNALGYLGGPADAARLREQCRILQEAADERLELLEKLQSAAADLRDENRLLRTACEERLTLIEELQSEVNRLRTKADALRPEDRAPTDDRSNPAATRPE